MPEIQNHCSECTYFRSGCIESRPWMYCCFLKRRITARRKACRHWEANYQPAAEHVNSENTQYADNVNT